MYVNQEMKNEAKMICNTYSRKCVHSLIMASQPIENKACRYYLISDYTLGS
jgi:hypothetical protein